MNDPINEVEKFLDAMGVRSKDTVPAVGIWDFEVTRADGTVERKRLRNIVTANGLNALALRGIGDTSSPYGFIAIGTHTNAASLGSVLADIGEVERKAASTSTTSKSTMIMVATWAGAADGLTGVALATGAICNHVNSGSGEALNIVNSVATTLADSDFLKVQVEVQIGSHNL